MGQSLRRVLIVRTDRIGDVLLTLPMAEALKAYSPSIDIAMLIRKYTSELVAANHAVDQVLYYDDHGRPLAFFHMLGELKQYRFDAVVHTYPRFRVALLTWLARIPVRIGTGYRWFSILFNRRVYEHRRDARKHELEYNLNLLRTIDDTIQLNGFGPSLRVPVEAETFVSSLLEQLGVSPGDRCVILHPGSGGSARDWSPERFGDLAALISGLPHIRILITGGRGEEGIVSRVHRCATTAIPIVGTLTLMQYAALTKRAELFVSNSTGPLHIAAGVGTPVIGLFPQVTALSANRWSPVTDKKVIFSPVGKAENCNECVRKRTPTCECMESIQAQDVYQAARTILGM